MIAMIVADQNLICFQIDRLECGSAAVGLKGIDDDRITVFDDFKAGMSMPDNFNVSVLLIVDFASFYNIDRVLSIRRIALVELL